MEENTLKQPSAYAGECIVLTTKHAKSIAISLPFWTNLEASLLEYAVDTDQLGTFSSEIIRKGTALECVQEKCEWPLKKYGKKIEFALASEGSFGPHPFIPFAYCDHEILYFIDQRRDFHLHLSHLSTKTNFGMESVNSWEKLQKFAEAVQFPSHALILRPNNKDTKTPLFKGLNTEKALKEAFFQSQKYSAEGVVCVETDMRAHLNPSRMEVISQLATKLAKRLATHCPKCNIPGWGQVQVKKGLECKLCGSETELIKSEIFGCVKCKYTEISERTDSLKRAEPEDCGYCNP